MMRTLLVLTSITACGGPGSLDGLPPSLRDFDLEDAIMYDGKALSFDNRVIEFSLFEEKVDCNRLASGQEVTEGRRFIGGLLEVESSPFTWGRAVDTPIWVSPAAVGEVFGAGTLRLEDHQPLRSAEISFEAEIMDATANARFEARYCCLKGRPECP